MSQWDACIGVMCTTNASNDHEMFSLRCFFGSSLEELGAIPSIVVLCYQAIRVHSATVDYFICTPNRA